MSFRACKAMIPKKLRLPKNRISYLLKRGAKLGNTYLNLKFLTNNKANITQSRFCVIISAKTEPSAVKRNKLRRQIYEIIRLNPNLPEKPSDIIIIVRPAAKKVDYHKMEQLILTLFKKL